MISLKTLKTNLKMKNYILIFCTFCISIVSYSQVNGFFGKKNYVDFGVDVHSPLLYNFYNALNSYETELSFLNYGFHITYSRAVQSNLAIGLEGGMSYFSVAPAQVSSGDYYNSLFESIRISKYSFMPKFEFAYNDALLPIGVSNQVGIGFNYYKALENNYSGSLSNFDDFGVSQPINITDENYFNFRDQETVKGYTFMYKLTMRIPINKSFLYHFGFRYTFNFVPNFSDLLGDLSQTDITNSTEYILSQNDIDYSIKVKENRSLIMFETGITFAF